MRPIGKLRCLRVSRGVSRRGARRGVVTTELAICLPVLLTFAFGMMELCSILHVRQRMVTACYDTVRLATRPTTFRSRAATADEALTRCRTTLTSLGVKGATVSITPADLSTASPGTIVTVTVTAPLSQNSVTSWVVSSSANFTTQSTMVFE
jgi:Flp pilus assembly protein TadG